MFGGREMPSRQMRARTSVTEMTKDIERGGEEARPLQQGGRPVPRALLLYLDKEATLRAGFTLTFIFYGTTGLYSKAGENLNPYIFYLLSIGLGVVVWVLFHVIGRMCRRLVEQAQPGYWRKHTQHWRDTLVRVTNVLPHLEDEELGFLTPVGPPPLSEVPPPPPPPPLAPASKSVPLAHMATTAKMVPLISMHATSKTQGKLRVAS